MKKNTLNNQNFIIVGIKKLYKVAKSQDGGNCDFWDIPTIVQEIRIFLKDADSLLSKFYELKIYTVVQEDHESYSKGNVVKVKFSEVNCVENLTHVPNRKTLFVELDPKKILKDFNCGYFNWSIFGPVWEEPDGSFSIGWEFFKATGVGNEKPLVYIYMGNDSLDKLTMAKATGMKVHDSHKGGIVDEMVYSEIIVFSNKDKYTVEDVKQVFKKHNLDVELVPVQFG